MTKRSKEIPGPKPEHVHIEGDWEDAVKNALKKPPPPKPSRQKPPTDKQADGDS